MGVEPTAPILGRLCATIALLPQSPRANYESMKMSMEVHAGLKERYADNPLRSGVDGRAVKSRHPYHMSRHG